MKKAFLATVTAIALGLSMGTTAPVYADQTGFDASVARILRSHNIDQSVDGLSNHQKHQVLLIEHNGRNGGNKRAQIMSALNAGLLRDILRR